MTLKQQNFLNQFDSNFRSHIIEFSKRLTELSNEYDVLIFLARKAACLADCLEQLEMTSFYCTVTSSRILDMNLDWLNGKKVAIIDDALISGTTIYQALQKLKSCEIEKSDVYVLSVDENWWNKNLVTPISTYLKLNSDQTSLICSNIVRAISIVPRPYTIDYPLFKMKISEKDFQEINHSANWQVYESTSSHQNKYNITNLTIFPSETNKLTFSDEIGLDVNHNSIFKIRVYALQSKSTYWCQVLPIVILPPLTEVELNKLFNRICENIENKNIGNWFQGQSRKSTLKGKLLLVQYYLGCRLTMFWYKDLNERTIKSINIKPDLLNTNFLFPPPIADTIRNIATNVNINFSDLDIEFQDQNIVYSQSDVDTFDENIVLHKLSKPFLDLYHEKELRSRQLVKTEGVNVFENTEYKNIINRLNQGYSLNDLKNFISGISSSVDLDRIVSYFLDIYIDKGAIVPITYIKGNLIFRAFRHGEDVEFSENEIRLCVSMLENFVQEYEDNKLPHTIIEKLLVLFIRIGIEKDFLTITTNPLSEYSSIGIRYYLHGAVVGSFEKNIYKVNFKHSLTNVLQEAGYLHKDAIEDPYTLSDCPKSGVEVNGLNVANQLGLVMGNLLKQNKSKISLDELILLSTCPYAIDLIGALAAELYIFQGLYYYQRQIFFPIFSENKKTKFSEIRKQTAYTALNSGTWKFIEFKNGTPWKTIKKIETLFDNRLYGEVWKGFWPSTGKETSSDSTNPEIKTLIEQLAAWLFKTRFLINLIEISLSPSLKSLNESSTIKEIEDILSNTQFNLPKLFAELSIIYNKTIERYKSGVLKKDNLYTFSTDKVKEQYHLGRQHLAAVDALANSFGKIDKITYYYNIVVIDYKYFNLPKKKLNERFNTIINQIRVEAKNEDNVGLFEIPKQDSPIKTGIWICANGKQARKWLIKLCSKLINTLEDYVTFKFTFFLAIDTFKIVKKESTNQYYAPLFWDVAKELLRKKFKLNDGHELIYFTTNEEYKAPLEKVIFSNLKGLQNLKSGERDINISTPYDIKMFSNHFVKNKKKQIRNIMDIGILTIVPEEISAVTDFFKSNNSYRESRGTETSRRYYFGTLKDKAGTILNVVATQSIEQGNRSIISAYTAMSEEFNPNLIVLLGIGGGIHDKINIGDVAICDSIIYYDKRAETSYGTKHRGDGYKINAWTKDYINEYHHAQKSEEPYFDAAVNNPTTKFKSMFGSIGSGEAVIKYKDAEVRKWLIEVNEKTLAVETEAGGVGQQFYEDELNYSKRAKGILILRGISDKADVEKKDEWRLAASKNAMRILEEIINANSLDDN